MKKNNNLPKSTSNPQKAIEEKNDRTLKTIKTELFEMQKQIDFLQKELFSDPLTGAHNRKWFIDYYLNNEKFQNKGYIAFIDLNKFKKINDIHGHITGDQVLKYFVRFLKQELSYPGVEIIRYAGDEFIIIFDKEKTSMLNVESLMKDTQEKLSMQKLKSAKIEEVSFSFSYGLTSFNVGHDLEYIFETVDKLMYQNKQKMR